jgi:hypothetical protein
MSFIAKDKLFRSFAPGVQRRSKFAQTSLPMEAALDWGSLY